MDNPYKIAIVQHPPVFLNLSESVQLGLKYVRDATANGARLIVFPETWLPGYPVWLDYAPKAGLWDFPPAKALFNILYRNSIEIGDSHFEAFQKVAEDEQCVVVMGAHEKVGRTLYNTIFYFLPDGTYQLHRKLMPTYTEKLIWGMGDGSTLSTVSDQEVQIGGLVCWEHWMPLTRAAMHQLGEHIHIAQWPMVKELHQTASKHYAFEAQCFVIAAGCTLTKQEMMAGLHSALQTKKDQVALELIESIPVELSEQLLTGGSAVIKPNSEYLVEPVYTTSTIIFTELDLSSIIEGNLFLDTNGHYSRPDIFQLTVDTKLKQNVVFKK